MRVGFDISQTGYRGGIAVYTQELASQLVKHKEIEWVFFYSSLQKKYSGSLPNVKTVPIPSSILEPLFNKIRYPNIESFIGEVDIFHSSDWTQPKTRAKKVTTVHDLVPILYPKWSHPKVVDVQTRRLKIIEEEIDLVIVVSESTKNDLLQASKIPEKKIVVIHEGVSSIFKPQENTATSGFKKKYDLPDSFVLAISGIGERRNLGRVKQVCEILEYNLVITGETLPWLPYRDLPFLYSSASVLLYPSFYEGFGLPILEAMSCGTPVITSDVSSMPEVGGKAAIYVDPNNVHDIAKKLKEVMEDRELKENLIRKGLTQAKKFSWEKAALETIKIYESII